MSAKNPKVDFFFEKDQKWQPEFEKLRKVILDCGLTEALKWGFPCYSLENSNIVLIHGFKEYCAVLFFKGALINDPKGILIQQTKNVQSARQVRFTSVQEIVKLAPTLKTYIQEAIEVEKAGLKVQYKKPSEFKVPDEFQVHLKKNAKLKTAFNTLTPGRQKGYLFYFSQPKLSKTRTSRVEKYMPLILQGKGMDD